MIKLNFGLRNGEKKLNILFIHSCYINQFTLLHKYFQETNIANSLFLTSEQEVNWYRANGTQFPKNLLTYAPDGDIGQNTYYYISTVERSARHSLHILYACKKILETHKIDLIVAHGYFGAPHMLFDEIDVPIVTYIEFPSFRHHQWDPKYPPHDGQRYNDKYNEMLYYYAAMKSALVITPSLYAKNMFPAKMQGNIIAQMEGFDPEEIKFNNPYLLAFKKEPGCIYVGFSASGLTSEKGFEQFIIISKRLSELNTKIRYVLLGDPKGTSYCYENSFVANNFGIDKTFKDYLFSKYEVNESLYICTGKLDMPRLSTAIHNMDFFLYPLQFGSANWGLYEILLRGKIIVASNRCFLPEVITDGQNGFLLDYDDIEGWANLCNQIANNLDDYKNIGYNAAKSGEAFHIENIAKQYVDIFNNIT